MAINIVNKLSTKCQNCPFFEVVTQTEEINLVGKKVPDFNITIDCKHHDILCDGLEAGFTGGINTEPPREDGDKQKCSRCGTTFFYEKNQNECMCPVCGAVLSYNENEDVETRYEKGIASTMETYRVNHGNLSETC